MSGTEKAAAGSNKPALNDEMDPHHTEDEAEDQPTPYSKMSHGERWKAVYWVLGIAVGAAIVSGIVLWSCQHVFAADNGKGTSWGVLVPIFVTVVQAGTAAVVTVFVGVLGRNNSLDQAEQAKKQADRQAKDSLDLSKAQARVQQREMLMQRQANAITHMGDDSVTVQAAAVSEMVWLILAWSNLAEREGEGVWETEAEAHCQELIDLAYKTPAEKEAVGQTRADGLRKLGEELPENHFRELDFRGVDLSGADLINANLNGANLKGAKLHGAELGWAKLTDADLQDADLTGAKLPSATLTDANLWGATLIGADLQGAILHRAILRSADLSGITSMWSANLKGTNLYDAKQLEHANLIISRYDAETVFPDGKTMETTAFDFKGRGMVFKP